MISGLLLQELPTEATSRPEVCLVGSEPRRKLSASSIPRTLRIAASRNGFQQQRRTEGGKYAVTDINEKKLCRGYEKVIPDNKN